MGGSEIMAYAAMICINLALLQKQYKYIQLICVFSARSRVLDCVSYNSLQLANQSTSQLNSHVSSTSLLHLSWMPQCAE